MKKFTAVLIAVVGMTISTQAQSWWNSKRVKGNGTIITKNRTVGSFDKVSLAASFDVKLIKGKEGAISIKGEENIIPLVETEVRGNTLKIKFKNNVNISTTRKLTVTVAFENIEGISLGGSGNIYAEDPIKAASISFNVGGSGNIKAKVIATNVKTNIGGSGNIRLSGKTEKLKSNIAGSGSIRAYDLKASSLKASIAGSGNIKASVSTKIKASVVGSGNIYYKGEPKYVDIDSLGSGDAIKAN